MPDTFIGLLLFVAFLVPGFVHFVQRRALVPLRSVSSLVETANLVGVSLVTNLVALSVFGLIRLSFPGETPDAGMLARAPGAYAADHLPYVFAWCVGLVGLSSSLALLLGARSRYSEHLPAWLRRSVAWFGPDIIGVSSWYQCFEDRPDDYVYVGCDLIDGSYIAGYLDWYSTDTDETQDRELVLAGPLTQKRDGEAEELDQVHKVIVSARQIAAMYLTYIAADESDDPAGLQEPG